MFITTACKQEPKEGQSWYMFMTKKDPKEELASLKTTLKETQERIAELEAELNADSNNVEVKSVFVDLINIKPDTFIHYITITGSVESDNQAFISPEINGQIKEVLVKEGQHVKKGQALVILNSEITQKTINEVQTNLELARTVYKKQKELWDQEIGSEIQYLQAKNNMESLEGRLETLKAQKRMATIKAPYDGVVDNLFQHEGEMATPGRQVLQLINLQKLKVYADMSERYLPYIHKGDMAKVSFPTYPNLKLEAPIYRVGNMINPANRTVRIQVNIKNTDNKLKPNIISNIELQDYFSDTAIAIPSIIIKQDITGDYIFVVKNENGKLIAEKRYVKTGVSHNAKTLITDGLNEGDKIIYNGYNLVRNGSQLKINKEF
jgi:RND family efflux transporter MFP subunit